MATTHPTSVRNAIADLVVDLVDAGGGSLGAIIMMDNSTNKTEIATLQMENPAFGAAAAGVATANDTAGIVAEDTSATGGTTTYYQMVDTDQVIDTDEVFDGDVGTSGTDIVLSTNVIPAAGTVQITSFTYTAPS